MALGHMIEHLVLYDSVRIAVTFVMREIRTDPDFGSAIVATLTPFDNCFSPGVFLL